MRIIILQTLEEGLVVCPALIPITMAGQKQDPHVNSTMYEVVGRLPWDNPRLNIFTMPEMHQVKDLWYAVSAT